MSLAAGSKLGPYEILAPIGAGGMGEVYRARDTKLERDVAIKVLPAALAQDPERLARFEREAKVLAALNHPNIAQIYGIEDRALIMELVDGQTLQGPLPLETALDYARQIADALEAAHEKSIIHRDLKPANIMITPSGVVKVLDFGLAAVSQSSDPSNPANSPTLTISPTRAGMILGTAAYMSPEQARGKAVDKRADIWAFGVVLYEMLTGKQLFQGETVSDTLAQVLTKEPDWKQLPAKVRRLLRRCLDKDPKRRLRDIGDAWELLEDLPTPTAPSRSWLGMTSSVAAGVFALVAATLAFIHFREKPPVQEVVRFEIPAPANAKFDDFSGPVVSRDGRKIAFIATGADRKPMIWVRSLDAEEARPLAGTEDAYGPFWSPDSRFLAFASGGKLKKIGATGGPAQPLCDAPSLRGGVWTSDNRILFGTLGPLQVVSASGGMPTPLTVVDHSRNELAHAVSAMLPDGHHFFYLRVSVPVEKGGVYIGSLDARPEQQGTKRLLPDFTGAVYVPSLLAGDAPGFLLFVRGLTLGSTTAGGTLMAQPFDLKRLELSGEAVPVAEQVTSFSSSPTGVLAFWSGGPQGNTQLTWYDRKGNVLTKAGEIGEYNNFRLAPDEKRIAFDRPDAESGSMDVWVMDLIRGTTSRLTFDPAIDNLPIWSPDGLRILYPNNRTGVFDLYVKAATGAGQEEVLVKLGTPTGWGTHWSRDGRFIMYEIPGAKTGRDLWIAPQFGDRKPFLYLQTQFNESEGSFSPDGRWVAYVSDESGRNEIYVQAFPLSGAKWQISTRGGSEPSWRKDGTELFYLAADRNLMAVPIQLGAAFEAGVPKSLFPIAVTQQRHSFAVANDGQRFLVSASPGGERTVPMTVVLNWQAGLKK
jgi:Tol biopolymer transport system component/predicted Ser/Thr protein kinase